MKKPFLAAFVVLFFLLEGAWAELRVTEPIVNLGEIRGGVPLQVSFPMSNNGREPIEILEVNRGCGCLAPRLDKRHLEPGEKTMLLMGVRTLGHPNGPHTWTATIRYRAGDSVQELPLALRAIVKNDVTVHPAVCALFVETTLRQEVTLTDLRKPPLTVTQAETTSPSIKVQTKTMDGGVTKIILEATGTGLAPGRHDEMLSIYTSDPLYGHLQVPITLTRADQSAVLATPARVHLLVDPGKPIPATLIRLRPRGEHAVVIEKVVADDPGVTCTWAAGPGTHAMLKIQVQATRSLETTVRVTLREPVQETVVIPVQIQRP